MNVRACDWVVYIQPPPKDTSDPADVLKYLARYMTGGPISDRRLIEVKDGRVYFLARAERQVRPSSAGVVAHLEFLRLLDAAHSAQGVYQGALLRRLEQPADEKRTSSSASNYSPSRRPPQRTSLRHSQPVLESPAGRRCRSVRTARRRWSWNPHTRRPSWRELFYGPDHPRWMEWRGSG